MRIAVLGTARSGNDPRTVRLVGSLVGAGHEVSFLSSGAVDARIVESAASIGLATRRPAGRGGVRGLLRRLNPPRMRISNQRAHAASMLAGLAPDVVYVSDADLSRFANGLGFVVANDTKPADGSANTIAGLAPHDPALGGFQDDQRTPWVDRVPSTPSPGRHAGGRVVLCYHPTAATPARYLHAALERAGVSVDHRYPDLDLSDVPHDVAAVVIVESPYPALTVSGETSVPVLFWVHHGELHLYQNIRLADRYRADAVLLAHSWHLGHRFPVPVYRFPFGVPTEMLTEAGAFTDRPLEVSMVAAGFDGESARYATRRRIVDEFTEALGGEHVLFTGGMPPDEVFSTYAASKVVIDEGGSLHRPITMRVFEATGSGAALLTDPAPGIELLFRPDTEFIALDTSDAVRSVTADTDIGQIAEAGYDRALGAHTYDHRVDELFAIVESAALWDSSSNRARGLADPPGSQARPSPLKGGQNESPDFLSAVQRFAEIDTIACSDRGAILFGTSSYVVWSHRDITQRDITVDAVVVDDASAPTDELLQLAHRYVFSSDPSASTVRAMITNAGRTFVESTSEEWHIFDFETPGYIVRERR